MFTYKFTCTPRRHNSPHKITSQAASLAAGTASSAVLISSYSVWSPFFFLFFIFSSCCVVLLIVLFFCLFLCSICYLVDFSIFICFFSFLISCCSFVWVSLLSYHYCCCTFCLFVFLNNQMFVCDCYNFVNTAVIIIDVEAIAAVVLTAHPIFRLPPSSSGCPLPHWRRVPT